MARKKTGQAPATQAETPSRLSWNEERFVEAFVRTGCATTAAIESGYGHARARQTGYELRTKSYIKEAIERQQERDRAVLNFRREDALKILIAMVTATLDDFADVLENPEARDSYLGLGDKRYAIKSAKKSAKFGNEIQLVDRKAALDDLWEKLGLDKDTGEDDRQSFLGRFADLGQRLGRKGSGGGSTGEEGST